MQHTLRAHAKNTVLYALIGAGALTTLMPFFWMLSSSLMTIAEMFYFPPKWIPNPPQWRNYADTINAMPFLRFTWNTLYISGVGTLGMLLVSSIAAYAFGRMRFPGKEPIFMVLMACMSMFMVWP